MSRELFLSLVIIVLVFLWVIAYYRLYKKKVYTFAFVFGSIGFFTIGIFLFRNQLESILIIIQMKLLECLKFFLYDFHLYYNNYSIVVKVPELIKVIELNYECSGVVEVLVFSSIILFYPIKSIKERAIKFFIGNGIIILANILRLTIIIISVKYLGHEGYEFAHRVVARIVFYFIIITMYYKILTKYHVNKFKEV